MTQNSYKFVRLGEGWLSVKGDAKRDYQEVIQEHAQDGWRLFQIFAPGPARKCRRPSSPESHELLTQP